MDRKIKVAVIGSALMAFNCVRFATERGCEVVACIGRRRHMGEDVGELAGIGANGVRIEKIDDLEAILDRTRPDIVCDCGSGWPTTFDIAKRVISRGYNLEILAEEMYYLPAESKDLAAELDALAKANGVSVIGLGMQDCTWSAQPLVMSGNCHKLEAIIGENWCILDHAGPSEFNRVGLNLTEEEFYEYHRDDPAPSNAFGFSLWEIADELGLHVLREEREKTTPVLAEEDYVSPLLSAEQSAPYGGVIRKGLTIGSRLACTLKTEEGIDLTGIFHLTFLVPGAKGKNIWRFVGEPTYEVVVEEGRYDITTSTSIVNRIPDVLNAPAGYLTVKDLPKAMYHHGPLNGYVQGVQD
jgi:4-hydroxy-tetrahydrodipicolinate reductase